MILLEFHICVGCGYIFWEEHYSKCAPGEITFLEDMHKGKIGLT